MTRSRLFLLGFGLLLLSAVGTGFYVYQNLPELLRVQAQRYLQQYGVEDIEFEGLHITRSDLVVEKLGIRGAYENYTYQAIMTAGDIRYNWRLLLGGGIDSLFLSSLKLSVVQTAASEGPAPELVVVDSLLPQQIAAQLPLQSLRINRWSLDYRSPNVKAINASGSLLFEGNLDAQIRSTVAGGDILVVLRSDVGSDDLDLDLDISVSEGQSELATLSAHLARAKGNGWTWNLIGQAQHTPLLTWLRELNTRQELELGIPAHNDLVMRGQSAFTATLQHPNELYFAATPGSDERPLQQLQASFRLTNEIRQFDVRNLVDSVNGVLDIEGTLKTGDFQSTFKPLKLTGNLSAKPLSLPESWRTWLGWRDTVPAQLEAVEAVNIAFTKAGDWSVQAHSVSLSLGDKHSGFSVQKLNLNTRVTGADPLQATTQLNAVLSTRLRKQTLPQLQLALTQQGSMEQSEFSLGLIDTAENLQLALKGNTRLSSGSGSYQLNAEIKDLAYFSTIAIPLLQRFELLQDTVALDSGTFRLDTEIESKTFDMSDWEQHSHVTLENATGSINEYRIEGFSLNARWSGIDQWKTLQPLEVSVAKLHLGVMLEDIHWRASLPKATPIVRPKLQIEAFSATVFGGQLILPDAQFWDFAAPSNQITVQAKNWQLGEMVALQQGADIQATGRLDGELPMTVTDGRVIITNGYLRAQKPGGSIRYRANDANRSLADSSPELALAMGLLSDFQYQVLSTDVALDKEGNLLMGLSLEGSNPEQYEGQSINFNINLEQNIDPLLQSLMLDDNLVDRIKDGLN